MWASWPLCSSDTSDSLCLTWHTPSWLAAPVDGPTPRSEAMPAPLVSPGPSQPGTASPAGTWVSSALPFPFWWSWLWSVTHNFLSRSKLWPCRCFRITVALCHFPNEGETPQLGIWGLPHYPGQLLSHPCRYWVFRSCSCGAKTNRKKPCEDQCKQKSRTEWGWLLGNHAVMKETCTEAHDVRSQWNHWQSLIYVLVGKTHQFRALPWWNFVKAFASDNVLRPKKIFPVWW